MSWLFAKGESEEDGCTQAYRRRAVTRHTADAALMLMLVCTVLVTVLMVVALGFGAMLVSMFMHVFVFMTVGLSLCMGVLVVMDVLMRMSAFHGCYLLLNGYLNRTTGS